MVTARTIPDTQKRLSWLSTKQENNQAKEGCRTFLACASTHLTSHLQEALFVLLVLFI